MSTFAGVLSLCFSIADFSCSVMVSNLKEFDSRFGNKVDDAVLLSKPSRPGSSQNMFERFGLSHPSERFAQYRFNQL